MANYCQSCGALLNDNANFCPNCGAQITGGNTNTGTSNSSSDDTLKTAATIGATVLGVSALSNLARSMTHRRRPPYMGPMGGPRGGYGGPGGPGGPHGGHGEPR